MTFDQAAYLVVVVSDQLPCELRLVYSCVYVLLTHLIHLAIDRP